MKDFNGKGKFVSIEGGEGCGKSTQIELLKSYYRDNPNVIFTREPGGTDFAEEIRDILTTGAKDKIDPMCETLLHYAARRDHIVKMIKPAIDAGKIVITDRYSDSSFAYQGFGHKLGEDCISRIHKLVVGNFMPTKTILLDLDLEASRARTKSRGNNDERYEQFDDDFHENVRNGFLELAKKSNGRIEVLDASGRKETLHRKIIDIINACK